MDFRAFPKVELHCHLDGILDPSMVRAIQQTDPAFPIQPSEFERAYPITSMESFFKWWDFIKPIKGSLTYYYPILSRHIEHLKAQSVSYTEIMIAAGDLPRDPVEAIETLQTFRQWVTRQAEKTLQIEFVVAFGRNRSPQEAERIAGRILALYEAGLIVGVALVGPEQGNPVRPLHMAFAQFHEAGMGIEIHAGEWCGPESIWDALAYGYPDRIGHGVSLFRDAALVELFRERQLHFELCPTSNLKTRSVSRLEEHPIGRAMELGLNFSINTDDPGPFQCSLTSECELLATVFGFAQRDFERVYDNSWNARFASRLRTNKGL